jgi:hypothetical protein
MAQIEQACLHTSSHHDRTIPLALVLIAVVVLVDRGADPTIALGSMAALIAVVGRVTRG